MSEESRKGGDDPRPNPLTISDDSLQRIRQVLSYQFDLEILHKWREVHVLQEEIERGKRIQTVVEKLIMNGLIHSTRGIYFVEHVYGGDMPTSYPSSARSTPGGSIESSGYSPGRRGARSASYTVGKDRPQTEPQAQFEDPQEVPSDYFNKHPSQLKQELDLAMIRADVIGPVQDTVRRPMIHVESGPSKGEELGLPGSVGENESKASVTKGSRYYVRRRIIIGNAAKSLLTKAGVLRTDEYNQEEAVAEGNLPTHKWRIYIKSPKSQPDPSYNHLSFIRAVRFFLHPSYRPNDIVDVTEPPFELIRSGWGEFPIRIQIHFWDPRNRPVELVHLVRVLTATTGKYTTLAEQAHDLDLDRRTDFKSRGSMVTLPELESRAAKVSDDDVLSMAIGDFPLAGKKGKRATSCPVKYRPASSMEEFLRMDIIQQKQIEQQRAASLCSHLMSAFPTFTKNTGKVVSWCREKGYTPASVASLVTALDDSNVSPEDLLYCRFCGLAHLPQDKFDILQKNCSLRPRKIHVTSKTSSADLLGRFELLPENNDVVKRLKQECFGSTFMPYCQAEVSPVRKCDYEEGEDDAQSQREEWTRQKIQELHLSHFHSKNIGTVRVMNCAMQVLLRKLVDTSLREIPDSKERRANTPVLLTPLHLYRAILNQPELDFLTNAHMLGGALPKDGPSPPTL